VWQKVTGNGGAVLPWCGALDYCEGLTLGAVDDWRLPNIRELQSLADYGRLDPAIDPTFSAESGAYWSSTSVESGQDSRAWIVEFGPLPGNPPGAVVEYDTDSHVRAVRGGQITPPETNCVDNVDNDMDGDTDCADADCAAHPTCPPPPETNCNNNVDDDSDGSTDCDDCDCVGTPSCPAAPSDLPHTGQTVCKDELGDPTSCTSGECPGQDGLYLAGCTLTGAARYVDNGDGTVVDNCTGLMWHQDTADISGDGAITGDPFPTGDRALWRDVLAYSEDLTFAGHEDWRLPNIRELQSIIDYGNHSPAIDTDFFVDTVQNKVWSSTLQAGPPGIDPRRVWFVWSKEGGVGGNRAHRDIAYVRPVRSGGCLLPETGQTLCYDDSDPPIKLDSCPGAGDFAGQDGFYTTGCPTAGRFSDNGDGTVSDSCTGLLWQKADDGNTRTWCNALDYCETLSLAGFNDWRLPNLRELQSIIDYSNRDPAIDGSFDVTTGRRWSSTPLADSAGAPNRAWIVSFGGTEDASWFESDMASTYFVLAVREP
jgi:hypothetical protein